MNLLQLHQFARGSLPADAKAARPHPSLCAGRAATQSTFDHQKNGPSRAGAARGVCSIHIPADLILLGTQGCVSRHDLLKLGRASARPLFAHSGIGVGCNRYPFANLIQYGRQGTFQRLAKGPHNHLKTSGCFVPKPKDGAERDVGTITQGLGND